MIKLTGRRGTCQLIRRPFVAVFHALPELYQQRLLDDPEDWKAMEEVIWLDHLLRAEEIDKVIIASKKRITKKADKAATPSGTRRT